MTKKRTKSRKSIQIGIPQIIIFLVIAVISVISYTTFGSELTIVLVVGLLFILGISHLLDKMKSTKKRRRVLNFILIFFFMMAILVCSGIIAFIGLVVVNSPEFDISMLDKREASIFYDNQGVEIARVGSELRENVTYDDLPEVFIDALIATEDSRFFQHNGFDAPRFIKASIGQALGNGDAGGASTLSMQVIKNTYTDKDLTRNKGLDGITRKFEDIYLSVFKLEKNFSKEEIIEYYVNNHDLSNNVYGVEEASKVYFGKSVRDLNLTESALLVGIFNNPTKFNLFYHPEAAAGRRRQVLNLMVTHGYITREEADIANSIPVTSLLVEKKRSSEYEGYIGTVILELKDKFGIDPQKTSVLVYTNMDRTRQKGLDDIFSGKTYKWENDSVQSGVAVIESATGKIVAVGAGRDRLRYDWNLAVQEKNQIGSTAKPLFDYGPAIEYLNWSTYEQIIDEPWTYSTGQSIANSDNAYNGKMSIRKALADSRNIPALKTFQTVQSQVGNKKILEFVTNLGLTPETLNGQLYESSSIGAIDGITVMQMAGAYAAFGNGGTYIEPTSINKIVYRDNNDVKTIKPKQTKAMSEATAFMVSDMLVTAVEEGYSAGAKIKGVTVAAKTGTTNFDASTKKKYNLPGNAINDVWIVGFDPEYSLAMWYGYQNVDKDHVLNANTAGTERGRLYRALGEVIFNKNGSTFTAPNSVVNVCVEDGSDPPALPSAGTPEDQVTCEYFFKGTEPTEISTKYDKLETVKNLKVSYDEASQTINITWNKLNDPVIDESFGSFGYNIYYGDVLLDFTTDNSYSIQANANISGTYKVVTTFEKYDGNQSNPATFEFVYKKQEEVQTPEVSPTPSPALPQ